MLRNIVSRLFRYTRRKEDLLNYESHHERGIRMWKELNDWIDSKAETTQGFYRSNLNQFCKFFNIEQNERGAEIFMNLTINDAQTYVNKVKQTPAQVGRSSRVADKIALNTLKGKIGIISLFYRELMLHGLVKTNPFAKFKKDLKRAYHNERRPNNLIDFSKVQQLIDYNYGASKEGLRDRALVGLLFGGALRRSEVIKIRLCDVYTIRNQVKLNLTMTKKQCADSQFLPQWASRFVKDYVQQRWKEGAKPEDSLLVRYLHDKPVNKGVSSNTVYDWTKRIFSLVGLPEGYSPHCARVTVITRLLEKGLNHRKVQRVSRHSSIQMVEYYDKMRDAHREEIAQEVEFDS